MLYGHKSNRLTALKTLALRLNFRPPIWRYIGKHPPQNGETLETDNTVGNALIFKESRNDQNFNGDIRVYGGQL